MSKWPGAGHAEVLTSGRELARDLATAPEGPGAKTGQALQAHRTVERKTRRGPNAAAANVCY